MNSFITYVRDVFAGVAFSMLGGTSGYFVFLVICSLYSVKMPNGSDLAFFPQMLAIGFIVGVVVVPILRAVIGTIRAWSLWGGGCFLLGAVLGMFIIFFVLPHFMLWL
jgi:hypothetical protein